MSEEPTDEQLDAFAQLLSEMTYVRKHRDTRPKGTIKEDDVYSKLIKDEMDQIHPIAETSK